MRLLALQSWRKSGRKNLSLLPYLFTFLNAFLGFLAIITALEGNYTGAAYCIMLAWCMDIVDGNVARALGVCSNLGMELDSLCDAISFCLAPTIILYCWQFKQLGLVGISALGLYLCCGLYRLARYNCATTPSTTFFVGLPTPIAALFVSSFVVQGLLPMLNGKLCALLTVITALLMISTIRFLSFKQRRTSPLLTCSAAALLATIGIIGLLRGYPVLLISMGSYILVGVGAYLYAWLRSD